MVVKRQRRASPDISDEDDYMVKSIAAKASPGIVGVVTHDVPAEMAVELPEYFKVKPPEKEVFFFASGMIMECQSKANHTYLCTALAPACLFRRPDDTPPDQIKIDVSVSTGDLYKGKLLSCDFHYNLAVISFISSSPLQTVTLKGIDDVLSIDPTDQLQSRENPTFQLRPHSDLFKILPGTKITYVSRRYTPPYSLYYGSGSFSSKSPEGSCNELYKINDSSIYGSNGGPALNSFGEIIGIVFNTSRFLPSNIVTRWWKQYTSFGEFRRPFLGLEVAGLHDADFNFLAQFMTKFPDITTAVIVTKVEEYSQVICSGMRTNDVIVKLDGKPVKSKLQFFEAIWEKAGESVEFNVLRLTDGEDLNLSLVIEEANQDKFHKWPYPAWNRRS